MGMFFQRLGIRILARTPVPKLPLSYPPSPAPHPPSSEPRVKRKFFGFNWMKVTIEISLRFACFFPPRKIINIHLWSCQNVCILCFVFVPCDFRVIFEFSLLCLCYVVWRALLHLTGAIKDLKSTVNGKVNCHGLPVHWPLRVKIGFTSYKHKVQNILTR